MSIRAKIDEHKLAIRSLQRRLRTMGAPAKLRGRPLKWTDAEIRAAMDEATREGGPRGARRWAAASLGMSLRQLGRRLSALLET